MCWPVITKVSNERGGSYNLPTSLELLLLKLYFSMTWKSIPLQDLDKLMRGVHYKSWESITVK